MGKLSALPTVTSIATGDKIPFTSDPGGTPVSNQITKANFLGGTNVSQVVGTTETQTLTNKTIAGASNTLTVRLASDVSGTLPVANGGTGATTLAGAGIATLTGSETLTNKTLTAPIISTISNTGTLTLPTSTDTLVGKATTDTLTNKTLTAPVIATISNSGTITIPTGTDTLVAKATTDTLTNKRITSRVGTVADAATITPTADSSDMYTVTALAQAATIAAPSGTPTNGQKLILRLLDNATARALTWDAIYKVVGTTLPTTTVISKYTYVGCIYSTADSKWHVVAVNQEA